MILVCHGLFHLPYRPLEFNLESGDVEGLGKGTDLLLREEQLLAAGCLSCSWVLAAIELVEDLGGRGLQQLVLDEPLDVLAS